MQKMGQTLAVLREELEQEVQALSRSRSIEDRAVLMAKEAGVSKVRVMENQPPNIARTSRALYTSVSHATSTALGNLYCEGRMADQRRIQASFTS